MTWAHILRAALAEASIVSVQPTSGLYLPKPAFKPVSLAAEFFSLARATEQKNVIQKMCKKNLGSKEPSQGAV